MITTLVAMFVGMVVGTAAGGPSMGALGIVVGAVVGMLLRGTADAVQRAPADAELVREEQQLLCMPKGQVATATFVRDAQQGRWLDVERCTLCTPEDDVRCEKRCLLLVRDVLPARTHPVEARPRELLE